MKLYPWQTDLWNRLLAARSALPHAILLQGRAGIGKLVVARAFAQTLLCEQTSDHGACGICPACVWFEQGGHPDFRLLEPASLSQTSETDGAESEAPSSKKASHKINVAQIRELADFINLTTHRNGMRIVLIHPAEAMNVQAGNALLKTLEEPSAHTLIILLSHQPQQLLATIRSRCQKMDVSMPSKEMATAWLREQGIADAELCLAQVGYAPLRALSLSNPDYQAQRKKFLDSLRRPQAMDVVTLAESSLKLDLAEIISWLHKWVYDLLSAKLCGTIRYQLDYQPDLHALSKHVKLSVLLAYQRELLAAQRAVQHPLNTQLLLEQLLLSYSKITTSEEELMYV